MSDTPGDAGRQAVRERLLAMPGCVGVADGHDGVIECYVLDERAARRIPLTLGGFPVRAHVTGEIVAG